MKVCITGGAGYIGTTLAPLLAKAGHDVLVMDNFMHKQYGVIPLLRASGVSVMNIDVRDRRMLAEVTRSHDVFIPLAGIVGAPDCDADPEAAQTTNYDAVMELCHFLSGTQLVLFPNTNSGYGIGTDDYCTEESPLNPISLYGRTKCAAEDTVMQRENSIVFRLATVFGVAPRFRTDLMVNFFTEKAFRREPVTVYEAHYRRNFVHARDVAAAFLHGLENFSSMRGNVYNCGDTRANMTKGQLCERVGAHVPEFSWTEGPGEDQDKRDYIVANEKLEATGWRPGVTIDEGIDELLTHFAATAVKEAAYA